MQPAVTETSSRAPVSVTAAPSDNRWLLVAIAVLSCFGIVVSAVSLQRHYAKSASSFCEFGEKFNCDIVNRSEYSTVMGIPVAGIGMVGYAFLLALATLYRGGRQTPTWLLAAGVAGLVFALYLTYVEGYVLDTWCILCLSSLATIMALTVLAMVLKIRSS
jgi:vitamin-K-epoxide reductase (warfarin-sensitive)